jgi:hypothetical protein
VWEVQPSDRYPEGSKFSFVYIRDEGKSIVYRMDNAHGRGAHEHRDGKVRGLPDLPWERLLELFDARVRELRETTR